MVAQNFFSYILGMYLTQNSPAIKKCAASKKAIVKKDVKSKVVYDGTKLTQIVAIKIFVISLPSQLPPWISHLFSQPSWRPHFFFYTGVDLKGAHAPSSPPNLGHK